MKKLAKIRQEQETYADVRPWLQAFDYNRVTYDGAMIQEEVNATYDAGYTTWLLWNANGTYVDGAFLKNTSEETTESTQ